MPDLGKNETIIEYLENSYPEIQQLKNEETFLWSNSNYYSLPTSLVGGMDEEIIFGIKGTI